MIHSQPPSTERAAIPPPADYKYMNSADWAVIIARPDGSVEELTPPVGDLTSGPPHVGAIYHELPHAIRTDRPATPDFNAGAGYHRLLEAIQRASGSGVSVSTRCRSWRTVSQGMRGFEAH
jgi:hypothetical protein